ncbi:CBS domain-containing protein [Streptomyces sp. NPDC006668]|uniref:CBS domain-containing protein n=1 Tax=Streptomyces sp. NPDC006668 TaxID=3156903 RepID=UPI0033F2F37F
MTAQVAVRGHVADAMVTCPKTLGPHADVDDVRTLFDDDHVHMALVVAPDGRLLTTIERPDIPPAALASTPATEFGTLDGRTVSASDPLHTATTRMARDGRRRLAVTDGSGRLLGLLCLKRSGDGYCSDEGIRARADERERTRSSRMFARGLSF